MPENLTPNTWENYLPSSSEKKQAVLMYMFVGLLLSLGQQDVSPYMHHHIKQSMGRVVLLVTTIFVDVILFIFGTIFWKGFSVLAGVITIPIIILGILCVKQARDGKYQWDSNGSMKFFSGFSGLGSRVLNLFDADHYQAMEQIKPASPSPMTQVTSQNELEKNQQISTNTSNSEIDLSQYAIPSSPSEKTE
ncbi:MAG: hypothetical protein LBG59_10075 [Candidatus Peribacteria bacterium]|jgi:hypothetical protein|nr:hypothetical protein [Candidatus Peribacteria bacterium]